MHEKKYTDEVREAAENYSALFLRHSKRPTTTESVPSHVVVIIIIIISHTTVVLYYHHQRNSELK